MSWIFVKKAGTAATGGIVTSGLVLHLDAGDSASYSGSGTTWTDLSASGNNGTLVNGPTYDSANSGSLVFDGTNDYVDVSSIALTGEFTLSCWLKRNSRANTQILFGEDSGSSTGGPKIGFDSTNYFLRVVSASAGLAGPAAGVWKHVAITRDSANKVDLYEDAGTPTRMFSDAAQSGTYTVNRLLANGASASHYFSGNIASVSIYSKALSAAEVTQNYDAVRGRFGL